MEQAQEHRDCVRPQGDRLANVSLVLGLDKRLHEAEETIQQLQREIDRQRAGHPPRVATTASANTASSSPNSSSSHISSSSGSARAPITTVNSISGWLNRSARPASLDVAVAAHTSSDEPTTATAAASVASASSSPGQSSKQQQQQQEVQLQRLAALKEEVQALKAALAVQDAAASCKEASSTAASDASGRDQGAAESSPLASPGLAGTFAGSFARNTSAPQSPLQKQRSSIARSPLVQKQLSGLPALPTESAAAEAITSSSALISDSAAAAAASPPLVRAHSAGEKVAVLMQELRAALAEQEAEKGEVPAGVRSGLAVLLQATDKSEAPIRHDAAAAAAAGAADGQLLFSAASPVSAADSAAAAAGSVVSGSPAAAAAAAPTTPSAGAAARHSEVTPAGDDAAAVAAAAAVQAAAAQSAAGAAAIAAAIAAAAPGSVYRSSSGNRVYLSASGVSASAGGGVYRSGSGVSAGGGVYRSGSGVSASGGVYRSGSGIAGSVAGRQRPVGESGRTTFSDDEDGPPAVEELEDVSDEEFRLLSALSQPLGFHKGKPLAALIVFRCCMEWGALEARRTRIFQHIIQVIVGQIEEQQQDNNCLAYWLTNTATLLHMLQRNTQPDRLNGSAAEQQRGKVSDCKAKLASWLWPLMDLSGLGGGVTRLQPVTIKAPALRFMQQLDVLLQKIFPKIRDRVQRRIMPMLWESQSSCIYPASQHSTPRSSSTSPAALNSSSSSSQPEQQHRTTTSSSSSRSPLGAIVEDPTHSPADAAAPEAAPDVQEWSNVLAVFDDLLLQLHNNWVPRQVVAAMFGQLFAFVNVQLFNQVMLRRECCSLANAEYVFAGLEQVAWWIDDRWEWLAGCWEELQHIRQAVMFLTEPDKPQLTLQEIGDEICPMLTTHQLYRLANMFNDDTHGTEGVSAEVLAELKAYMVEEWRSSSSSFLLDDDSKQPLPTAEIVAELDDKELYVPVPVPEQLRFVEGKDDSAFDFLERELRFAV